MSCKTRRVTLNPSPYPDNTMSRRYCQPHMGAVYDAGQEPTLRVWDPSNPITHPNCMCTYVPIGPPEIFSGEPELTEPGTYYYGIRCGPLPYTCGVDDDRITLGDLLRVPEEDWEKPGVPEYALEVIVNDPCEDNFSFTLTVMDKDEYDTQQTVQVRCKVCDPPDYEAVTITGPDAVLCPGGYQYTADGTADPFTWEILLGDDCTISNSGYLTVGNDAAGAITIKCTDACGTSAYLRVRISNKGSFNCQCYVMLTNPCGWNSWGGPYDHIAEDMMFYEAYPFYQCRAYTYCEQQFQCLGPPCGGAPPEGHARPCVFIRHTIFWLPLRASCADQHTINCTGYNGIGCDGGGATVQGVRRGFHC